MAHQPSPPDANSPALSRLNRFLAMTANDRGPMADLIHLLGVVALVGGGLSLAAGVIWYTVRTPSSEPPRLAAQSGKLPESPALGQIAPIELPSIEAIQAQNQKQAPVGLAGQELLAEESGVALAGLSPQGELPASELSATQPVGLSPQSRAQASPADAANHALPPGFFKTTQPALYEVFNTASDRKAPYLALRSRPDRKSNELGQLNDGTQLKVVNRFGSWQFVQVTSGPLQGKEGFVYGKYLRPFVITTP